MRAESRACVNVVIRRLDRGSVCLLSCGVMAPSPLEDKVQGALLELERRPFQTQVAWSCTSQPPEL